MIAAVDAQGWVPHGRSLGHPGRLMEPQHGSIDPLADQFRSIDLSEETKEFWLLRACPGKHGDDELYARGRTVIWSRGAHSRWQTMRSFTLESSVVAVCWATFHPSPSIHQPELQNTEASFEGIFMADSKNISVYGIDGQDYITSSQFPVSSVWPTHIGILIERKINSTSAEISTLQLPLVYSLQHPYDDIKPIITKKTGQIGAITQPGQQVLFTNIEPPICVLYDATTGLHSAWTIRKATEQESLAPNEASTEISVNDSIFPSASFYTSPTASFRAVSTVHTDRSSTTRHPSLAESLGGGQSFDSYWRRDSSLEMRSPLCCDAPEGPLYPVFPEVCLDHLWTDTNRSGSASRVFLNTDLVGIVRLCYMVPSCGHLFMIKVEQTNQQEQILFGSKIALPALDAVTFTDVPMVLILEKGGCLALYSGCQLVTKVLVPCGIESVPILSPPTADTPSTYSFYSALTSPKQASSSFKWRRSSLRPECSLDGSYFGNTSCALSPVLPGQASLLPVVENKLLENTSSEIVRLRDPTGRSVTLEYKGGRTVRISLPEMHSSYLVARVVSVLRSALMREEANILLAKWYCVRNAPGSQNIDEDTEWHLFMTALLGLLGYDVDHLTLVTDRGLCGDVPAMPEEKKKRISDEGTFEDWKWMIQKYKDGLNDLDQLLGLDCLQQQHILHRYRGTINSDAPLFLKFSKVLYSLHLLYEDMKLDMLARPSLPLLAPFLHLLALDLQETERADLFWRDFPLLCKRREGQMTPESLAKLARPENLLAEHDVPHILSFLQCVIGTETDKLQPYPYVQSINSYSRNVIQAVSFPALGRDASNRMLSDLTPSLEDPLPDTKAATFQSVPADTKFVERSISIMIDKGLSMDKLQQLPPSLALMCLAVTRICHEPPPGWSAEAYQLVSRQDLAELKNQTCGLPSKIPAVQSKKLGPYPASNGSEVPEEVEDGMEGLDMEVLSLRFPKDQRIQSVRRMLQSSRPVRICMTQRPEVSDHDFIEEQERHLYAVCTRTMALPVGRGMFTLGTIKPNVLEPLPVPRLCLTGRSPTRGTTVDLSHIEVVPNMNLWPLFHNGVAAGLRVCPNAVGIDSTWIAYNKQKGNADTQTEHAGFLMALGLNGHLSSLNNFKIYEYLQKCHEMTSIGLLLGIAASKRGSSDQEMSQTIRTVCLHIEAMLPPTSLELNIAQNIQVAALLCLGLLYQGSAHRHITEVLLSEIGRPPGPEMDNCVDRESYSLAAGLALGLVVLGQGAAPMADLRDLAIPDTLHHYMIGGHARQLAVLSGAPNTQSARQTPRAVASWMKPPDTQYLLDFIRPDFLMLRVLARGLILWDDIMPTTEWVESNIPPSIHPDVWSRPAFDEDNKFDLETMNQAYNNILAGACLALGMRFAGTSNKTAFDTIYYYVSHFISMLGRSSAEIAGKSTIECCTNVAMLSAALVMAGTGDLHCVRLIRMLRSRVGSAHPVVTYGSHLATHMALGLLFLGGGRYTLSTSPPAIAAMLCAFFPKFPTHSNDNRYHLQAFRHLYVLAAEPRLLLPRCVDTGICDYCMLQLHYKDTPWYKDQSVVVQAPYLLPELKLLNKVQVGDSRYWTITFERDRNWEQLKKMLREMRCLPVKRCAGCLPHVEDPKGFRTLYAQSLSDCTDLCGSTWSIQLETILSFSKSSLVDLARLFLTENPPGESLSEKMHKKRLSALTYECCVQDKSSSLQFVLAILHVLERLEQGKLEPLSIWDVKILQQVTMLIQYEPYKAVKAIVSKEASHSLYGRTRTIIDGYEKDILPLMAHYLKGDDMIIINDRTALLLATYLTFYDIPTPKALACVPRPWNHVSLMTHKILAPAADKLVTWQELGVLNM